jgi:hypothetical protein
MSLCAACQDKRWTLRAEIESMLDDGRACTTDADCRVVAITASCEFGCGATLNGAYATDEVNEKIGEWNTCMACTPACEPAPDGLQPICERGHCVMYRD